MADGGYVAREKRDVERATERDVAVVGEHDVIAGRISQLEIERASGIHRETADGDRTGGCPGVEGAAGIDGHRAANAAGATQRAGVVDDRAASDRAGDTERALR